MSRFLNVRKVFVWVLLGATSVAFTLGTACPPTGGDNTRPVVPPGNRPPYIIITSITTTFGNNFAEVGENVSIAFTGEDAEDASVVRVFASSSGNPTPAQEIPIIGGFPIGPGSGNGVAVWNTTGLTPGSYNIFAEIDDRTLDPFTGTGNPPVRVTAAAPLQLGAQGSRPATSPPQLVFLSPNVNLGLSAADELTLRYIIADVDSPVTVTLILDKDLIPTNDDVNNPGDPNNPATNIIILPSAPREPDDPVFDGDVINDPMMPIAQPDSLEIRRNPRTVPMTTPGALPFPGAPLAGEMKDYIFTIDFSQIPPRTSPYFIRAHVTDGTDTRNVYANGALSISRAATGVVDVAKIGFEVSGARFQGFSAGENLGTDFVAVDDLEMDGVEDFMIASRFGSPRNRFQVGVAYLVFGRKKVPFPQDTDNDGLPDGGQVDQNGEIVDFPEPPDFLPNPYDPINVGRFGGNNSVNSISAFYRGTLYAMPVSYTMTPPPIDLADPDHPLATSAGLTSITRAEMSNDGIPDLVFGLPFCAAYENQDDDPADECSDMGFPYSGVGDLLPNNNRCDPAGNDDIGPVDGGLVIMVDGTNDLANVFRRFTDAGIAGQFDPAGAIDDEGVIRGEVQTPQGARWRGAWHEEDQFGFMDPPLDSFNEYGRTVAGIPSIDNDLVDELLISSPGWPQGTGFGRVSVWLSLFAPVQGFRGYSDDGIYGEDNVHSLPAYASTCPVIGTCTPTQPPACVRCFIAEPPHNEIFGEQAGDRLGFAESAGQVNQDGTADIACGAPGASRNGLTQNGIFYVVFSPAGGFGNASVEDIPHLQVVGTHNNDRFGTVQTGIDDLNGDSIGDCAFASEDFDADINGDLFEETDVGYVGVIFGQQSLTGELGFTPEEVGTPILRGVRFLGASAGARAGRDISSARDFNGDGAGDFLISSPNEIRCENTDGTFSLPVGGMCSPGQITRTGVAYLIFGGPHLDPAVNGRSNNVFVLSDVGSPQLPGIVFISRNLLGTGPETRAQIEYVGGLGDIDGDGFDDIGLGAPRADFVNLSNPAQRRLDAGEIYIIYGNSFGSNDLSP